MKCKFLFILLAVSILSLIKPIGIKAESYFRADFASSNLWVDFVGIWATYGINKSSAERLVVDNYLTMSIVSANVESNPGGVYINSSSKTLSSLYGFKLPQLLNGLNIGAKWGYQEEYESFIRNWGVYGSIHAGYDYFILEMRIPGQTLTEYDNSMIRLSPGIGTFVRFGKISSRVTVELNLGFKYDIPIYYNGEFGSSASCLKSGISPRITLTVAGKALKEKGMNVGVFYEWSIYKLFKSSEYFVEPYSSQTAKIGINFTMYPFK